MRARSPAVTAGYGNNALASRTRMRTPVAIRSAWLVAPGLRQSKRISEMSASTLARLARALAADEVEDAAELAVGVAPARFQFDGGLRAHLR